MKSKKDDYVNREQNQNLDKEQYQQLTLEEQLELFAEILIDQYLKQTTQHEKE